MNKQKLPYFIGKQLSRLKLGQSYYSIVISTLSAISLISLAFGVNLILMFFFFPIIILLTYIIGYILDIYNVNTMDILKSNEIQHRYLNTRDLKIQEFQILQLEILIKTIRNEKIDISELYKKYYERWNRK